MADTSTGEYTPKETPKVLSKTSGVSPGKGLTKKKKSGTKAGSYNPKARKGYEDMLKEAGKI